MATPDKRKEKRLSPVNMIKLYQARDQEPQRVLCNAVFTVTAGDRQDMEASPRLSNSKLLANPHEKVAHLSSDEQRDLEELLVEFNHLFPDVPGCTNCVYHDVDVGTALPCKQHPYIINPIKMEYLKTEIDYMLENKIIEPSPSDWSPVFWFQNQMAHFVFAQISES